MIRFGRLVDRASETDRRKLAEVQALFRRVFPKEADYADGLGELIGRRADLDFEATLLVAEEEGRGVVGFALLHYFPRVRIGFLDYIGSDPERSRRGIGRALYESVREYLGHKKAHGLLLEVPPDEPAAPRDPAEMAERRSRARFYESFGAYPILGTRWDDPERRLGYDSPMLLYDDLGRSKPLPRTRARAAARRLLETRYAGEVEASEVRRIVESFRDDPVRLRSPRYSRESRPVPPLHGRIRPIRIVVPAVHHEIHHVRERGYVERPARVGAILRGLRELPVLETPARHVGEDAIRAVHDGDYVSYLRRACESLGEKETLYPQVFPVRRPERRPREMAIRAGYYCIDTFTPLSQAAYRAARGAVDCAVTAAGLLRDGEHIVYALCRPPGHHAQRRVYGGFCYFNNAAIAAHILSAGGRVAILDLDYHHGNGQQDIFYGRPDVLTVSIHGEPRDHYPYFAGYADERGEGEGLGFNRNFPVRSLLGDEGYQEVLAAGLREIGRFRPDWLVVALGYDTMRGDPTGNFDLSPRGLRGAGQAIGRLGLRTLVVQEGGYALGNLRSGSRAFFGALAESWYA